jgi:hypothetical protein
MSTSTLLTINAEEVAQFYRMLYGDTGISTEIRCIHPDRKHPTLSYWGSLEQPEFALPFAELNSKGYGIYLVVNQPDQLQGRARIMDEGKGVEDRHITRINALFVELDNEEAIPGENLEKLQNAVLEPSAIIRSSLDHKLHGYWLVEDCPPELFTALQIQLISLFGGDPACKNLSRIMRIPGFWHTKREPLRSSIVEMPGHLYTLHELCEAFDLDRDFKPYSERPEGFTDDYTPPKGIQERILKAGIRHAKEITGNGRHKTLIWLALSAHENRLEQHEAEQLAAKFVLHLPSRDGEPVPLQEAIDVIKWAYSKTTAGEPWAQRGSEKTSEEKTTGNRTEVILETDHHLQAQAIVQALHDLNSPPTIFQRGRDLVRIVRTKGEPSIETLNPHSFRAHAQERIKCVKEIFTKDGPDLVSTNMSQNVAAFILASDKWPFPYLESIIYSPSFAASGELVTSPGYSYASRMYLDLGGFTPKAVPERPTQQEVEAAKYLIMSELLADFPFVDDASRAHAVALGVQPYVRAMIQGPTPLYASVANAPGTGKSLLVELLTYQATGLEPRVMTEGGDDDEWRKRITSTLLTSPPTIMIDNVNRKLDSGALAAVLTATRHDDRLLQTSKNVSAPNLATWVVTGNNLLTSEEIARRTVWLHLDAKLEQPWRRDTNRFKHPNLRSWVNENRLEIVHAFLILVQNWIAQGRLKVKVNFGSYESWAEIIGGVLQAANIPGFLANATEHYERADQESQEWREFVLIWAERYQDHPVSASDIYRLAEETDSLMLTRGTGNERSQKSRLGRALTKRNGRIVNNYKISLGDGNGHAKVNGYRLTTEAKI